MATGATDPNGWLLPGAQPGSVMVKIVNTSRDTLNNQLAACLQYTEDKGRYVVHLTKSQQQVSIKPENLVQASMLEKMKAQFELFQNHPEFQRQVSQYYNLIQQKTGTKPEYVAAASGVALVAAMYFFGFSKIMLLLSMLMLVGIIAAPDLNSPPRVILNNFPMRFRAIIREQIPVVGPRIAANQYLSMAVMGLVLVFFVNALFFAGGSRRAPTISEPPTVSTANPHFGGAGAVATNQALMEEYYRKGFEDGQAGTDFGTSMPETVVVEEESPAATEDYDFDFVSSPSPPTRPSFMNKVMDFSSIMSIMYLAKTGHSLGSTPEGSWDYQLAIANLQTMDTMRLGFLGFSVYRVVSKFL